jgi:hypothetical protein
MMYMDTIKYESEDEYYQRVWTIRQERLEESGLPEWVLEMYQGRYSVEIVKDPFDTEHPTHFIGEQDLDILPF